MLVKCCYFFVLQITLTPSGLFPAAQVSLGTSPAPGRNTFKHLISDECQTMAINNAGKCEQSVLVLVFLLTELFTSCTM